MCKVRFRPKNDGHARLHPEQQKGTRVDTIKRWEAKRRHPVGLAAKVLATIEDNPAFFHELAEHKILMKSPERLFIHKHLRHVNYHIKSSGTLKSAYGSSSSCSS